MSHVTKKISSFTKQDIAHLLKNAHVKARVPGLRVLMAPAILDYGRILIIASRHSGNAVKRNLIKRRFKSIFNQQQLSIQPFDYVVIVKKEGIETSYNDLVILLKKAYISATQEPSTSSKSSQ